MRWASVALALLALNVSLTFGNIWPTLAIRLNGDLSGELAVLVIALVLAQGWRGPLSAVEAAVVVRPLGHFDHRALR